MMAFEKAIDEAGTMFLFDRRSQKQLEEMAEGAQPGTRDHYLIQLTHAAFAYYNAAESLPGEVLGVIRQVQAVLRQVKLYREDRVFYTLALKLEVDVLMHQAGLHFADQERANRKPSIFAEDDSRALSICETLLKNLPASFEPLPGAWFTSLVPLFPPYRELMLEFYEQRGREHRTGPLAKILRRVRDELVVAAGMLQAKKFLGDNEVPLSQKHAVRTFLLASPRTVAPRLAEAAPGAAHVASDVMLPKGIGAGEIDLAIATVQRHLTEAREEKNVRAYTTAMLQLGILNFLREEPEEAVRALAQTLRATGHIGAEDKRLRQYRHDEFPDIPFMMGTAYLRVAMATRNVRDREQAMLERARIALMRALALQPHYHQAYVNLLLALHWGGQEAAGSELVEMYLGRFNNDLTQINAAAFANQAFLLLQGGRPMTPEVARLLILAHFCTGGEMTKGQKMLQELKTLYVLNAHEHSIAYLDAYRNAFRVKDPNFVKDLSEDTLHSALLFYLAHAFTSHALQGAKQEEDVKVDYTLLIQGIDLNGEALFFNTQNSSALRLVETQGEIIQFAVQRSEKRWDNINTMMGQRFQFYEEYLRQEKCHKLLKERLDNVKLGQMAPAFRVSPAMVLKMEGVISTEQRDRLRNRVQST
jgi:hypothetical protein